MEIECDDCRRLNLAITKLGVGAAQEYAVENPEQCSNEAWTGAIIEAFHAKQQRNIASVPWTPSRQLEPVYTWDALIAEWVAAAPSVNQNAGERTDSNSQRKAARGRSSRASHVAITAQQALGPLLTKSQRRQSAPPDSATYWHGDFQYKRVKRVGQLTNTMMTTRKRARHRF